MRRSYKHILMGLVVLGFFVFCLAWGLTAIVPLPGNPKTQLSVDITPALIERGAYLARVGDCVACHSLPGKSDFSGGVPIASPIGGMVPPNITPDKDTGIGNYTYGEFERAVRYGIRQDGQTLYPAMPWVSYNRIADSDMEALYAYFMKGVTPVSNVAQANTISWPLSIRWPMTYWRWLFGPDQREPIQHAPTDPVALGAYYVNGLGHCGTCHTPRALTLQEVELDDHDGDQYLAGGQVIDGYFAPSLRGEMVSGLGRSTPKEITELLKTGRTEKTATFGPMSDVVTNSTQYMTQADLDAVASYLKQMPAAQQQDKLYYDPNTYAKLSKGDFSAVGAKVYMKNCEGCHLANGLGYRGKFPALALNSSVNSQNPAGLIRIVLAGATNAKTENPNIVVYAMPGFADRLSDQDVADVVTFIRSSWGNHTSVVSASQVTKSRQEMPKTNVKE